jgi:hypothetical protein
VPQATPLTNVVDSLKVMSLTSHASSKLKSLDYSAITIEFVNCLPTKFTSDILFELPPMCHPLGHSRQLQGMDRKYNGHAWCKLYTNNIKNLFGLGFKQPNALDICVVKMIFIFYFSIFLCVMKLVGVVIFPSYRYLGSVS